MRPIAFCFALFLGLALNLGPTPASGQMEGEGPRFVEFNGGDLDFRSYIHFWFQGHIDTPAINFFADEYLGGEFWLESADGGSGWAKQAWEHGYNAFAMDYTLSHKAQMAPTRDLLQLVEKSEYNVYQTGMASSPGLTISHGMGAAFAIKARSMDPKTMHSLVIIDAWGPQGTQDMVERSSSEQLAIEQHLEDELFVRWGLGPRPGQPYPRTGIDMEGFQRLYSKVDPDQPPYWVALLSTFDGGVTVEDDQHLQGFPILAIRTARATPEMEAREDQVLAWLKSHGAEITRWDLASRDGFGLGSSLPMAGPEGSMLFEQILEWSDHYLVRPGQTPGE